MTSAPARETAPRWLLPGHLQADPDRGGRPRRTARDWLVDTSAFLLSAGWALLCTGLLLYEVQTPDWMVTADLTAGWLACLALWLRRRWPVGLTIALTVTGFFSTSAGMAALIALFTVAVHRRYPVALLFGALYGLTSLPYYAVMDDPLGQPGNPYWLSVTWAFLLNGLVVAWGMFVRARRQLVLSLRDRAHRAEAEQHLRAEQARHLERERIAREMHDVLAHRLSLVSMHAGALEYRTDASPQEVTRAAGVIRQGAHRALQDLREVIGVLREDDPGGDREPAKRPQPTLTDLPTLLAEPQPGVDGRVRFDNRLADPGQVPESVGRTVYRIVQEALTNVRKHAPGAVAHVTLAGAAGDGLTVEVRNPAPVGATGTTTPGPIPGTGTGLVGLAERAALVGGRLEHGPCPDGGFRLRAWLPWPA